MLLSGRQVAGFTLALILAVVGPQAGSAPPTLIQAVSGRPSALLLEKSADAAIIAAIIERKNYAPIIIEFRPAPVLNSSTVGSREIGAIEDHNRRIQDEIIRAHFGDAQHPFNGQGFHRSLHRMTVSPMISLKASRREIDALAADPRVVRIHYDRPMRALLSESVPLIGMTGPNGAFVHGADGHGQAVAVLDTGVQKNHPFITTDKVILEACFSLNDEDQGIKTLCPNGQETDFENGAAVNCPLTLWPCSHGTHVAGIAAGNNTKPEAGGPPSGVAKAAKIISVLISSEVDDPDVCNPKPAPCVIAAFSSTLVNALDWLFKKVTKKQLPSGIDLASINLSIGDEFGLTNVACKTHPAAQIVYALRTKGNVATVVASGNDGSVNEIGSPACIPSAIAVGASTKPTKTTPEQIWSHTDMSSLVAVMAPGDSIVSSVPNNKYAAKSGTSMAAPHVAGAIAAIRSAVPYATVDDIERALKQSGQNIKDTRKGGVITRRRIQVDAALNQIAPIRLEVLPTSDGTMSGNHGGPFNPNSFSYRVRASSGTIRYLISGVPSWLSSSLALSGTTGSTAKTIAFKVNKNANLLPIGTQSAKIVFSNQANTADAQMRSIVLTVTPGPPVLSIVTLDADKSEGNSGSTSFTFKLSRSGETSGTSSVTWTVGPGASPSASADDFVGGVYPRGAVTFNPSEIAKTITVNVQGDTQYEYDENLVVTLSNPTGGATINSSKSAAMGVIRNDDSAPGPSTLLISPASDTTITGEQGRFGLQSFKYSVSASNGSVKYALSGVPIWLYSDDGDTATTVPYEITFSLNSIVNSLPPGTYSAAINFTNTTNGLGTTTRNVTLQVLQPSSTAFMGLGTTDISSLSLVALSADGSTVIGYSDLPNSYVHRAFRWSLATGLVKLPVLDDYQFSHATGVNSNGSTTIGYLCSYSGYGCRGTLWSAAGDIRDLGVPNIACKIPGVFPNAVSADGSVVVGTFSSNERDAGGFEICSEPLRLFRWTFEGGMAELPLPAGYNLTGPLLISADGSVVAGTLTPNPADGSAQPFRWTSATGMVLLGTLPGKPGTVVSALSADGSTVTGVAEVLTGHGDDGFDAEVFRWTPEDGMTALGCLSGHFWCEPRAISGDGSTITGFSGTLDDQLAFRWTKGAGMSDLGRLNDYVYYGATLMSADGSLIVGPGSSAPGYETYFRWSEITGMQDLGALISDAASNVPGWRPIFGVDWISADGTVFLGTALDPYGVREPYVARLPIPPKAEGSLRSHSTVNIGSATPR